MFNYYIVPSPLQFAISPHSMEPPTQVKNQPAQSQNQQYLALSKRYQLLKYKYEWLKQQNESLQNYIYELEEAFKPEGTKRKIKRRTEKELSKDYLCPYQFCKKEYASTLALNLHIRNKHEGGTKKERIAYIVLAILNKKQIISAQQKGLPRPETSINLCPQLIELQLHQYRQKVQSFLPQDPEDSNFKKQNIKKQQQ